MEVKTKKAKKKRLLNPKNYTGSFLSMMVIVIVVGIVVGMGVVNLYKKEQFYALKIKELEKSIEDEKQRATDLNELKIYVQTKDYIEKVAKEKLGLVNSDEVILKPEN